jgi:hypothetical protein
MQEFFESIGNVWELLVSLTGAFITAFLGVLMRHGHRAAQGEEWEWRRIMLDAPTVFVMGITAGAAGQYLETHYGFPELITWALAANFGYLGPTLVDRIAKILEDRKGK